MRRAESSDFVVWGSGIESGDDVLVVVSCGSGAAGAVDDEWSDGAQLCEKAVLAMASMFSNWNRVSERDCMNALRL